jgi:phage protein D/phage baseplate assembly protein gpV
VASPTITNNFVVEFDGKPSADAFPVAVVVEDHLHLPDSFAVTFHNPSSSLTRTAGIKIGMKARIGVLNEATPAPAYLISGEITALEAEIHGGRTYLIVRGYDESHRLMHGTVTESYPNATYAEIARKVAPRHGLRVGNIQGTSPTHKHVSQANESDWDFLRRLATEVGFELTVTDGKLNFYEPVKSDGAPPPGDLTSDDPLTLAVGSNLLELRAVVTAAEQVKEVEVRGWDAATKKAVVATAPIKTATIANGSRPDELATKFPGPALVAVDPPLATAKEVDNSAHALAEEVAASFTEMEGKARGNVALRAGAAVRLDLVGAPFDGKYVITSSRHTYDSDEGYRTWFTISGRHERSLLGLTGGDGAAATMRIAGVVPALVDDVDDPDRNGRVRLRFPWMAEKYTSDWCRVAHVGAGADRGFFILPEVNDEVLVAFDQGEVRRPFVLGGLYNGQDHAKTGPGQLLDGSSHAVNNRLFTSRKGHQLVFIDADDHCGVVVSTGDGNIEVRLDQANKKIEIKSSGDITVKADGGVKFDVTGAFEVKAQSITLEGQTTTTVKGAQVEVNSSGPLKVAGQPVQIN